MFQDLSRRSMETVFGGFETRLKFIKFGLRIANDDLKIYRKSTFKKLSTNNASLYDYKVKKQ